LTASEPRQPRHQIRRNTVLLIVQRATATATAAAAAQPQIPAYPAGWAGGGGGDVRVVVTLQRQAVQRLRGAELCRGAIGAALARAGPVKQGCRGPG
jgi:hypothetical protein